MLNNYVSIIQLCDLLWPNREQVTWDKQLILRFSTSKSVGYLSSTSIHSICQGHAIVRCNKGTTHVENYFHLPFYRVYYYAPCITTSINQNLPSIQGLDKVMQIHPIASFPRNPYPGPEIILWTSHNYALLQMRCVEKLFRWCDFPTFCITVGSIIQDLLSIWK